MVGNRAPACGCRWRSGRTSWNSWRALGAAASRGDPGPAIYVHALAMRSANGSGCGSLASIMVRSVPRRPQAKEPGPIPRGAGDGAGDGREAPVGRLPPDEPFRHDGDGVALALILAHEDCAGLEAALAFGRGSTLQEAGQQLHRGAVEAAQGRFLNVPPPGS